MKSEQDIKKRIEILQRVKEKTQSLILQEQYIGGNISPFEKLIDDARRCDNEIAVLNWVINE